MTPSTPLVVMPSPGQAGVIFAAGNLFQSSEFYLTVGLLIGVLLLGAVIIHYLDKWRNKQLNNDEDSPLTLSHYRQLFEQGELSEAEYVKVRDRIAGRMKQTTPPSLKPTGPVQAPESGELPKPPEPESS